MDEITYDHSDQLLNVLTSIAPNKKAQQQCSALYNEIKADNPPRATFTYMIRILADGVNYGNWPWSYSFLD